MQSAKRTIWGTTLEGRLGRAVPLTMDRSGMFRKREECDHTVRGEPVRGSKQEERVPRERAARVRGQVCIAPLKQAIRSAFLERTAGKP